MKRNTSSCNYVKTLLSWELEKLCRPNTSTLGSYLEYKDEFFSDSCKHQLSDN